MVVFRQEFTIINADDKALAKRNVIKPNEVRQLQISFLVDTFTIWCYFFLTNNVNNKLILGGIMKCFQILILLGVRLLIILD